MFENFNTTDAMTGGGVVAAVVLGWQRALKLFSRDRADAASANAETGVVQLMRDELARLAEQNGVLAIAVNTLQNEIVELRKRNGELEVMVGRLKGEIGRLTSQGETF